jgi:hypothetical protein
MSALRTDVLDAELAQLDDLGLLINDRAAAERVSRLIGALLALTRPTASTSRAAAGGAVRPAGGIRVGTPARCARRWPNSASAATEPG